MTTKIASHIKPTELQASVTLLASIKTVLREGEKDQSRMAVDLPFCVKDQAVSLGFPIIPYYAVMTLRIGCHTKEEFINEMQSIGKYFFEHMLC